MNEITQSTLLQSMRNNVSMMGHEQTFQGLGPNPTSIGGVDRCMQKFGWDERHGCSKWFSSGSISS